MTMEATNFGVDNAADGSIQYEDGESEVAVTVYPTGSTITLEDDQYLLIATAVAVDENQWPHRVKCGGSPFGCFRCVDPKCVPPATVIPPPPPPLNGSGMQPTQMVLQDTLTFTSSSITTEDEISILVLQLDAEPTSDSVIAAVLDRVGRAAVANLYHVYKVDPPDDPGLAPPMEFPERTFVVLAFPVG